MEAQEYIWMNGEFVRWDDAKVHVLTHTLHYGGGAFEGIRVYDTEKGPAVFRLREHMDRLVYSAGALKMELPFSVDALVDATRELVRRNAMRQGYVRPIAYYGYGVMGINPRNAPVEVTIACWPWGAYLPHESVDIKTSSFIRIHPRSTVADAKINGHYVNSMMAVLELRGSKYHEALFLDSEGHVAEGPGENLFLVKQGALMTPKAGSILTGITRDTVMRLAKSLGLEVEERVLSLDECYEADEAFYTGTAAEVTPIRSIDDRVLGAGDVGPISRRIRDGYSEVVRGKNREFERFLTYV